MEEWDAYVGAASEFSAFCSVDTVSNNPTRGSGSPCVLDDIFTPSPSGGTPLSHSPVVEREDEEPAQAATLTADDFMAGFMGQKPREKKGQTLADLNKKKGGFLDTSGGPVATAPSKEMQQLMTYYEVLGVAQTADANEMKTVYKSKSMQFHPDRNPNLHENDKEMFKLITKAYETLSDPNLRAQYDLHLRMQQQPQMPQQGQGNWLFHLGRGQQQQQPMGMQQQPMGMGGGMGGWGASQGMGMGGGYSSPASSPTPQQRPSNASNSSDPFAFASFQ
eukprot:TRINITY_DN19584_c0_g1_i1.p1 TRINITY_DN19584_c0_g1~~TRINITY_DN19584_c0_g1_i1.p1  ORF type:complete len:277 (+),score=70.46 TRINITY_DN19584_c0_g1_i1:50-880(+)